MARHKWDGKVKGESSGYAGGVSVGCLNCECVKEILHGRVTYFLNDTVTDKAPPCEGEKIKVSSHKSIQQGAKSGQLQQHVVMAALPLCSCGGGDNDGHAMNCPWQENQDDNEP